MPEMGYLTLKKDFEKKLLNLLVILISGTAAEVNANMATSGGQGVVKGLGRVVREGAVGLGLG
jgi:hypothetical protein